MAGSDTRFEFTKKVIDGLQPREKAYEVGDVSTRGLLCRVTPNGTKTFSLLFRLGGKRQRANIGRYGEITLAQAKDEAERMRGLIRAGKDPSAPVALVVDTEKPVTVGDLIDRFDQHHLSRLAKNTRRDAKSILNRWVRPALGERDVRDVTRGPILALMESHADQPTAANRMLAWLHAMFNYAELAELRPEQTNPCHRIPRYDEEKRARILTPEELRALGRAFAAQEAENSTGVDALRLLIFTGCRKSEIRYLRWSEVDRRREAIVLEKDEEGNRRHKTGRVKPVKLIALNDVALALIDAQPEIPGNPYVFSGPRGGAIYDPWQIWNQVRERVAEEAERLGTGIDISDVRVHDLRHLYGTRAAEGGVEDMVIRDLLGHVDIKTTQRYSHVRIDKLRVASQAIADGLAADLG